MGASPVNCSAESTDAVLSVRSCLRPRFESSGASPDRRNLFRIPDIKLCEYVMTACREKPVNPASVGLFASFKDAGNDDAESR
jgi:hypothetical protein